MLYLTKHADCALDTTNQSREHIFSRTLSRNWYGPYMDVLFPCCFTMECCFQSTFGTAQDMTQRQYWDVLQSVVSGEMFHIRMVSHPIWSEQKYYVCIHIHPWLLKTSSLHIFEIYKPMHPVWVLIPELCNKEDLK